MVSGLSLPEWGGQRVKLYLTLLLLSAVHVALPRQFIDAA
jgi:hypothetical protein